MGSGNTCFSLPSAPCLFWATTFWTVTSLFLVCLQPLPLCAAAPSHLIRSQHSLPNLTSFCSHHCNPTRTSGPLHVLFPQLETLPQYLPRLPLSGHYTSKEGTLCPTWNHMWCPLKCELPRAGALSASPSFVCLTHSRYPVSTH